MKVTKDNYHNQVNWSQYIAHEVKKIYVWA